MGYGFFIDWYYIIIVVPAILFAIIAQINIKTSFKKYSRVPSSSGMTGAMAAKEMLEKSGVFDVKIEHIKGKLSDHYDPRSKTIRLSSEVFSSTSMAAIGVACHEAGHAIQHSEKYAPLNFRNAIIPICTIGSNFGIPIALLGLFFNYYNVAIFGLLLYSLIAVFQIATLPIEFNASKRAVKAIAATNIFTTEEIPAVKKILSAAALTYIASLLTSLANILRLFLIINRRK